MKFSGNLLSYAEAAGKLKISTRTLSRLVKAGKVKPLKVGNNRIFDERDLPKIKKYEWTKTKAGSSTKNLKSKKKKEVCHE